jgi:hypothetical protein
VMQEDSLTINQSLERLMVHADSYFRGEEIVGPAIMIADKEIDLLAGISEPLKRGECAMKSLRNDCLILKPEIKQIADDEEPLGRRKNPIEKCEQAIFFRLLLLSASQTEMHIGKKIRCHCFRHRWLVCDGFSFPD